MQVDAHHSTAYHPQTDGQTERVNQDVEQYLHIFTNYEQDDCADWLSIVEFQFNDKEHSTTKYSPFMLNSGRHPWKHMHQMEITNKTVEAFVTRLEKIRKEAELAMKQVAEVMKAQYD